MAEVGLESNDVLDDNSSSSKSQESQDLISFSEGMIHETTQRQVYHRSPFVVRPVYSIESAELASDMELIRIHAASTSTMASATTPRSISKPLARKRIQPKPSRGRPKHRESSPRECSTSQDESRTRSRLRLYESVFLLTSSSEWSESEEEEEAEVPIQILKLVSEFLSGESGPGEDLTEDDSECFRISGKDVLKAFLMFTGFMFLACWVLPRLLHFGLVFANLDV